MKLALTLLIAGALLNNSHDIGTLGAWGPYSKLYSGASHITDVNAGVRVDFTLAPGIDFRTANVPNELFENVDGCYPWDFSSDLSRWTFRNELEWKDRVYVDVTYNVLDERRVLMQIHCVNNTPNLQELLLHTLSSVAYAEDYPLVGTDGPSVSCMDYSAYEPARHQHNYALVYDGWRRGERRDCGSLTGSVLAFSGQKGDLASYTLPSGEAKLRWKADNGKTVSLRIGTQTVTLKGSGQYETTEIHVPEDGFLEIEALSEGTIRLDSFVWGEVKDKPINYVPTHFEHNEGSYVLKYEDDPSWYGVAWNYPYSEVNQYANSTLDPFLRLMVHKHNQNYFKGDQQGLFTSAFERPVCLKAQSDTTLVNLIVCGDEDFVKAELQSFPSREKELAASLGTTDKSDRLLPGAEKYVLGNQIIKANLLGNIVYPVWTQGQYIRHFTPGKHWNSLYTWDSGFISWALTEIDPVKAFETIRAYTTEEGCQSAFIHHGTPLPIQFFAFESLVGKISDDRMLSFMYPRLKQYYDFMSGHNKESTTLMPSGLLRTWDYFYNSGGWDDYPPQHDLRSHTDKYSSVAPMVSTSFYIRAAKILRLLASHMGLKKDVKEYDRDIKAMSAAILDNAWDPEEGYFGYVEHDAQGHPQGLYRWKDGKTNFNMGLDGVSPLVAGICTPEQESILTDHIFDPSKLWSICGISTVDQSAPYFTIDGYWNGCVWMPHQYILWKTMLDLGKSELAEKIASKALDVWAEETGISYRSFEHFLTTSGRGKGWHNFSGLSSPMVNWFASYYRQGTVTSGFDVLITDAEMSPACDSYEAMILFDKDCAGKAKTIILCMDPACRYEATLEGKKIEVQSPRPGLLYINLPWTAKQTKLTVKKI